MYLKYLKCSLVLFDSFRSMAKSRFNVLLCDDLVCVQYLKPIEGSMNLFSKV